jgi:catechol 2,3-dioxygenase-like lactoylglutathione lyase family enzyme
VKIERIGHVQIRVENLEECIAFYTEVLGFELVERDAEHGGAFLSLGST